MTPSIKNNKVVFHTLDFKIAYIVITLKIRPNI